MNIFGKRSRKAAATTSPPRTPRPRPPIQCLSCNVEVTHQQMIREMCPFLDSMGSGRTFLWCRGCGATLDFMIGRNRDFINVRQICIVAVPGPDYYEVATTLIQPAPAAFGWFLEDGIRELWRERQWDTYLFNWLTSGIPVVCAYAGRPTAHEPAHLKWIASYLASFTHTYYDEPILVPPILFGTRYDPEVSGYHARLREALRDLYEAGYRAYHGGVLSLEWLEEFYPSLIEKLAAAASLMPPQPESKFMAPVEGIMINGMQFTEGVHFARGKDRRHFESGEWDLIKGGTRDLIEKFFTREDEPFGTMRILVHTGACWSTWRSFGPFTTDEVWAEVIRLQEMYPPQRRLAPRVYEGRASRMSKIEIYDGRRLVREIDVLS